MKHTIALQTSLFALATACGGGPTDPDESADSGTPSCGDCDAGVPDAVPVHTVTACPDGSGDYVSLREAIAMEPAETVIEACGGSFDEHLVFDEKPLTIRGAADGSTVIDGGGSGSVIAVGSVPEPGIVLDGVTIRNGLVATGGGGILCTASQLTIVDSIIEDNDALHGGGIFGTECHVEISTTTFLNNRCDGRGGGALFVNSTGFVDSSTFRENVAGEGGGLAVDMGEVAVTENEFRENRATTTEIFAGGGGMWRSGDQTITGNVFSANYSARLAGGLFLWFSGGTVSNNEFLANESANDGGGLVCVECLATITFNEFLQNVAGDDAGGLRAMTSAATIEDNTFTMNTAAKDGGAAKISHGRSEFNRNVLTNNTAVRFGGGLELDNDWSNVDESTFTGNAAARGGALHSSLTESHSWITNSTFTQNTASGCGGAMAFDDDAFEVHMINIRVSGNSSSRGGGICADNSLLSMLSSIVDDNTASQRGGGMELSRVSGPFQNIVVADNQAPNGSALRVSDSSGLTLSNSILANNQSGVGVLAIAPLPTWTYNNVANNGGGNYSGMTDPTGSQGNLSSDPLFTGGSYVLSNSSPCLDTGDPGLLDTDSTRSDMGAYGGPYGVW